MSQDQGASAKADRAATPSEPSQSSVVSGTAGIPCAFTPGPWSIRVTERPNGAGKWREVLGEDGTIVIGELFEDSFSEPSEPTPEEAEANAALIGSAPLLYAALEACLAALDPAIVHCISGDARDFGKAALAKARGGQ